MKTTLAFLFFISLALTAFSQVDSSAPVYVRFPTIPPFTIYTAADSAKFTRENLKKRPAVFIIFDPFCDHCQHETKAITENISRFKNAQIIMVTYMPYSEMVQFYRDYKIADYPVITMGFDSKFFFPSFFHIRNLPAIFIYDKKGKYKTSFEGTVSLNKIVEAL